MGMQTTRVATETCPRFPLGARSASNWQNCRSHVFCGRKAEDGRDELDLVPVEALHGIVAWNMENSRDLVDASANGGVVSYRPLRVVRILPRREGFYFQGEAGGGEWKLRSPAAGGLWRGALVLLGCT